MNKNNQVYIITGGSSGLGLGTVKVLRRFGYKIVIFDLQKNEQLKYDDNLLFFKIDVTDKLGIRRAMENVVGNWGRIDGVVNCAGRATVSYLTKKRRIPVLEPEEMEILFKINVLGSFNMIKEYVTLQQKYNWKKGVIINTSSVASEEG